MKKLLVVLTVLAMATVANAALKISVGGVVDPPDTTIKLNPSDYVDLDITGDGQTPGPWDGWLIVEGLGTTSDGRMLYTGSLSELTTYVKGTEDFAAMKAWLETPAVGYNDVQGVSNIVFAHGGEIQPPLSGTLVDQIRFLCEGQPGEVLITLANIYDPGDGTPATITVMDTQVIHQIPEPITFALLGLGGLFLRRRK